jgi:hypothetical protein
MRKRLNSVTVDTNNVRKMFRKEKLKKKRDLEIINCLLIFN